MSGADALVNPVNCVGVMGKGLALEFKKRFPYNFKVYQEACESGQMQPGKMLVVPLGGKPTLASKCIINFPTKRHWRNPSRMEDIEAGLMDLAHVVFDNNIASVAVPALGCGLGGLSWLEVRAKVRTAARFVPGVDVMLYAPRP